MMKQAGASKRNRRIIWLMATATLLIAVAFGGYLIFIRSNDQLATMKQRGSDYLLKEDYAAAKEEYKQAIKLAPEDIVLYFQLAEAYIGLDDYIDAAAYLEQALKMIEMEPLQMEQYASLTVKLAECYKRVGDNSKRAQLLKDSYELTRSERILELLREYYPNPVTFDTPGGNYEVEDTLIVGLYALENIYYTMDKSDPTEASELYRDVLVLTEGDYEIRAITINEYGFPSEVTVNSYSITKRIDYLAKGEEQVRNKDFEGALDSFRRAISNDSKEPRAYYGIAKAYIAQGNYNDAIRTVALGLAYGENKELSELQRELFPKVEASLVPGDYTVPQEQELYVELIGIGKTIYYTLDGSIPDEHSKEYNTPVPLKQGRNKLTAVSLSTLGNLGEAFAFEYMIYYPEVVIEKPKSQDAENDTSAGADSDDKSSELSDTKTEKKDTEISETSVEKQDDKPTSKIQPKADKQGNIIWQDTEVEAAVRKALGKTEGNITTEEAAAYEGELELAQLKVKSLVDLSWLKQLSVLSCQGNVIRDAEFINKLGLDRIIAVYHTIEEVKAIDNTQELKKLDNFGICIASFSLGDLSLLQLLDFLGTMNSSLQELTNLKYLDLSGNDLTDITIIGEINNVTEVETLILRNNYITDISVLKRFKKLKYLDVSDNEITDFSPVEHVPTIIK